VSLLLVVVELALQIFASWTLAYHFSLLAGLPARVIGLPFIIIIALLHLPFWRSWQVVPLRLRQQGRFALSVLLLAGVLATPTLFVSNPNPDDFNFFHRALVQLQHLQDPFIQTDTGHGVAGLPPLSRAHVLTSYEVFVAMAAASVGADPVTTYHDVGSFLGVVLLVVVYVLLYGEFGVGRGRAVAATGAAVAFFLLDLQLDGRSFGNILLYLWTGKVLLWGVLVPITVLVAYRFVTEPGFARFSLVAMASVCAVGLSGSGIFMLPVLVLAVSAAYFFAGPPSAQRLRRAALLNLASLYPVVAALVVAWDRPADVSVWMTGEPLVWSENLRLVISDSGVLARDLVILGALPLAAGLALPVGAFVVLLSVTLTALCFNPLVGPLWIQTILPATYWRLLFLCPLPWCFGLIVPALTGRGHIRQRTWTVVVAAAAVALTLNAHWSSRTALTSLGDHLAMKWPGEYRFPSGELDFARAVSRDLQNRHVLVPDDLAVVLALVNPTVTFEAIRGTLHTFANAGQKAEGIRRLAAQALVTNCTPTPEAVAAVRRSVELGVTGIVARGCNRDWLLEVVEVDRLPSNRWVESQRGDGYVLFLRNGAH
jgi:hypothetical protein